ncbi:MAG: hypothetical protein HYR85_24475 [Planctomycetes bacterium]|nr:hypothetical protein [Planctomycetota bacterium]
MNASGWIRGVRWGVVVLIGMAAAASGDAIREIVPDGERITNAIVSGDGSHVVFTRKVGGATQVFSAATDGSDIRGLTAFTTDSFTRIGSVSDDGTLVAFVRVTNGGSQIFVATSTGVVRQLTFGPATYEQPRMNADGSRIFFVGGNPGGVLCMNGLGADRRLVSYSPAYAQLGNCGHAGNRVGGVVSGFAGDVGFRVTQSIEYSGRDRVLPFDYRYSTPLLSDDEAWFAATTPDPFGTRLDLVASDRSTATSLVFSSPAVKLAQLSADGSRALLEIDGAVGISSTSSAEPWLVAAPSFPVGDATASNDLSVIAYSHARAGQLHGLWVLRRDATSTDVAVHRDDDFTVVDFTFSAPGDRGREYVAALSSATSPGRVLADGRVVPLDASLGGRATAGLNRHRISGFRGFLDASGQAHGAVLLANPPSGDAPPFYFPVHFNVAFVILDPSAPLGIARISEPLPVTVWLRT